MDESKKEELEEKRIDYNAEMTNEEYRSMIIEVVNRIDNNRFLEFIYNFILSAIKKWL